MNMPLVGPSSTAALCVCSLANSVDPQPMHLSLQVYREPVQEPLHPTGETLKPSSAISTENWKPKDLVRVQGKLSKCSSTWHWIQRVAFLSFSPLYLCNIILEIGYHGVVKVIFIIKRKKKFMKLRRKKNGS